MSAPVVHEAKYDYTRRLLTLDVEFPTSKYVEVICLYNIYKDPSLTSILMTHGAIFWEGYIKGRQQITISVPATYINAGVEILYGYMDELFAQEGSIKVPPDSIKGLSDYYNWRTSCLSKAKWKVDHVFYAIKGYVQGGFIAIYNVIVDPEKKTVKVILESDGSTRYGDIYSIWFGSSGWMKWSTGFGYHEITMDWSKYWADLEKYGLYVIGREWAGAIVCTIVIPLGEMLIISLKIKSYAWPTLAALNAEIKDSFAMTVTAPYSDVPNAFCGFINKKGNPGPIEVYDPTRGWVSIAVEDRFIAPLGTIGKGVDYTYGPRSLRFKAVGNYTIDLIAGTVY